MQLRCLKIQICYGETNADTLNTGQSNKLHPRPTTEYTVHLFNSNQRPACLVNTVESQPKANFIHVLKSEILFI